MCGICGLVSLDGATAPDPAALAAMNETLVHRGPDSDGSLIDGPCGLAMRRLSIIDLAGGDQPIGNEDGRIQVIQNGEIYNYRELMEELRGRGHTFSTHSDTEVLVHLYEERGPAFVEALRGMFAIAIWDARHGRLRAGARPLRHQAPLLPRRRRPALLRLRAQGAAPPARVLARDRPGGARGLPRLQLDPRAAHHLHRGAQAARRATRWSPRGGRWRSAATPAPRRSPAEQVRNEGDEALAEELRGRLRDSVRAHLVSDVPVGVLLSGGIDSADPDSAGRGRERLPGQHLLDRLRGAVLRRARARPAWSPSATAPTTTSWSCGPDAVDLLPRLVEAFDEPFGDSSALPTYLVSQLASDTVKVVLSGEGGDELFGGYYTYVADRLAPRVGRAAPLLRPLVDRLPSSSEKVSFDYKAKRFVRGAHLPPVERHHAWKEIFSPDAQEELLSCRRGSSDPLDVYRARYAETEGAAGAGAAAGPRPRHLPRRRPAGEDRPGEHGPLARGAGARSSTPRSPSSPWPSRRKQKVRGFSKKRLLRRAAAPLVPKEIIRGRKQGFSIPVAAWLRGDLEPFARDVLSPETIERQGYLRPEAPSRGSSTSTSRAGRT